MKCTNCKEEIINYNYCPNCGTPISKEAKKIEESKRLNTRLETLLKLTEITNDEKTLNIIKDLVTKIKEEL